MRFLFCIFFGVSYLFLNACSHQARKQVQLLPSNSRFAYELREKPEIPVGIIMTVSAVADVNQQLRVNIAWANQGEDTLFINFSEALLWNETGLRIGPREHNFEPTRLLPSATDTVRLIYEPVSNLRLYQQTGLRGVLTSGYLLPMSFIQKGRGGSHFKDTLKFNLPQERYQEFLSSSNATEKISLYKIQKTTKQIEAMETHLVNIYEEKSKAETVRLTEEEIFVVGVNTRVGVYQQGDSLYMNLHIVNHSSSILEIEPQDLSLYGEGIYAADKEYEKVSLKKGERYLLKKSYHRQKEDSLWLNLKGVSMYESGEYLLASAIPLVPVIPETENNIE
jgi:hypothetical protein